MGGDAETLATAEEACRVYVGNLVPKAKETHLQTEFARFGVIHNVWIARRPPGFAFVRFSTPEAAQRAVEACRVEGAMEILGKPVRVQMAGDKAKEKTKTPAEDGAEDRAAKETRASGDGAPSAHYTRRQSRSRSSRRRSRSNDAHRRSLNRRRSSSRSRRRSPSMEDRVRGKRLTNRSIGDCYRSRCGARSKSRSRSWASRSRPRGRRRRRQSSRSRSRSGSRETAKQPRKRRSSRSASRSRGRSARRSRR